MVAVGRENVIGQLWKRHCHIGTEDKKKKRLVAGIVGSGLTN